MDGDEDPMVNPDKTPNDGNNGGEETTSGNLFRDDDETTEVTPGSSRAHQGEHIGIQHLKEEKKIKLEMLKHL